MLKYIGKRFFHSVVMIFGIMVIIFVVTHILGDPVALMLDPASTKEEFELMRHQLGLDQPLHLQFIVFLKNAVHGDFGESLRAREPAMRLVLQHLPATIELTAAAMIFMLLIGVPVGILSAAKPYSLGDRIGKLFALGGQAAPNFWLGIMAILIFGVKLKLLPISGRGGLNHLILPAMTLGFFGMAAVMRLTRSAMLDVLDKDYIRTARIKGLSEGKVVLKHAFKNALIPVVTYVGLLLAGLLGGSVITETIYAWPGLGRLAVQSITTNDFPVVQSVAFLASVVFISMNLLVDILYCWIDPRISYK
jgi:peptide/nickel transport system permease protein